MVIYCTTNLINNKKYIGKDTKNDPKYLGSGTWLREDITKCGKENFIKNILEYCSTDEELTLKEIYWIKYYNAVESDDYYNLVYTSGGFNSHKLTKEKYEYVCNKISNNTRGKRHIWKDIATRNINLSKATKGKPKPEGFGEKISLIKKNNPTKFTQEHRNKISEKKKGTKCPNKKCKKILQYDLNNNFIKEWFSFNEITKFNPLYKDNIRSCLNGYSKKAYGFIWKYKLQ